MKHFLLPVIFPILYFILFDHVILFLLSTIFFFPAAAAAAKSLQSCPTLCDPIDGSPSGSPVPGIILLNAKFPYIQFLAIFFFQVSFGILLPADFLYA